MHPYLTMAVRVIRKQRLSSAITIAGLGFGLAFFALLAVFVRDELTFDRFHGKADRIYIVTSEFRGRFFGMAHHFLSQILETDYPEVKPGSAVRTTMTRQTIRRSDRRITRNIIYADPGFFRLFSFDLVAGDPARALADPRGVVLTSETAEALGLGPNPLGETLVIRIGDKDEIFAVTGVVAKIPGNSSLRFDGVIPFSYSFAAYNVDPKNNDFVTLPMFSTIFLELPEAKTAAALRAKLPALSDRLYGEMWKKVEMEPPKTGLGLIPFPAYHLGDVGVSCLSPRSRPAFSWILAGIALLILILASFNAVNLSLARASARLKEIGVRKVVGARRSQLLGQLLTESLVTGLGALGLGLPAAAFLISSFNGLTGKSLGAAGLFHPLILAAMIAAVLIVCLFTSAVPARVLSRYPAASIVQGRLPGTSVGGLSKAMIVFQFTVSLVLLVGTLVMAKQLRFMTRAELGFDPRNIILVDTQIPEEAGEQGEVVLERFRNALRSEPRVLAVTADSGVVTGGGGGITRRFDKDGVEHAVEFYRIDWNYLSALDVRLTSGRNFSPDRPADAREGVLVNEALVKDFGLENPVGKRFSEFARDKFPAEYTSDAVIIGVVRDFHVASLHEPIGPMALGIKSFIPIPQGFHDILVKVRPGEAAAVSRALEKAWAGIRPDTPIRSEYLEDTLARQYRRDRNWGRIVGWAGGFALFISCLGLFGLTAVSVVRRTKEIGIRKVMGAREADILALFMKDILKWVAAAALLSWPIAYWATGKWLGQFAYRIHPDAGTFAGAALLAFLIAGLTISGQVVRAARSNPARNLRYE